MALIEFEKVSFGYPEKDLYENISFTIEPGEHAVLIGSNGCGKSSLVHLLMDEEKYTYEGLIRRSGDFRSGDFRTGYVGQFVEHETGDATVFDFLAKPFVDLLGESDALAQKMGEAENPDKLYEEFQVLMDRIDAVDGYNYEANIRKQLHTAGLSAIEENSVGSVSGGEYKLLYIIRNMLLKPQLLIMDEPDVFLDFENLIGLVHLINSYDGTVLTITHSRLLLSQCFDKVLHIENMQLQEYAGSYPEYSRWLLETRIDVFEVTKDFDDYIEAQQQLVNRLRKGAEFTSDPKKGKQLQARKKLVERMKTLRGEDPFLEIPNHSFAFPDVTPEDGIAFTVENYSLAYKDELLRDVSFTVNKGDKIAVVGANGTGKSSILRDIYRMLSEKENGDKVGYFRQITESDDTLQLSGGERNMAQLEEICRGDYDTLLLDEPTSHLDCDAQIALEQALTEYRGTVLMVSHDFFTVTDCAQRIFILENGTLREMSGRAYRKSIYKKYFGSDIFEQERNRIDTERKVNRLILKNKFDEAREVLGV